LSQNFIQITFLQAKVTQIGNIADRVFVQNLEDITDERLNEYQTFLSTNCGFNVNRSVKDGNKGLLFFSTNKNGNITGFQFYVYNHISGIAERYSSCTGINDRRQGIMKKIDMNVTVYLQIIFPNLKYIWTGLKIIDFTIDNAKKEASRKIRSGFAWDLQISDITPLKDKHSFRFLSFYWKPGTSINDEQMSSAIEQASKLIDDYQKTLYIPLSVINDLRRYRDQHSNQEYGGNFEINPENHEVTKFKAETLSTISSGKIDGKDITCNVPYSLKGKHIFSFHTHPDGCYQLYHNSIVGWPSSRDMFMLLSMIKLDDRQAIELERISTIHFVMAKEGIYSIRLSKKLVEYYKRDTSNREFLRNIITTDGEQILEQLDGILNQTRRFRYRFQNDQETYFMIVQILNVFNNFIIPIIPNIYNIPAFKVTFERYKDIKTDIKFTRY